MVCLLSMQVCLGEPEMKIMDIATLLTAHSSPNNYPLTWNIRTESQIHYSVNNVVPSNSEHINKKTAIKEANLRVHRSAEEKRKNEPRHSNASPDNKTESKQILFAGEELRSFLPEKRNPVASLIDHSDEDYTRNNFHFNKDDRNGNREGSVFREPKVTIENDKNSRVLGKEELSNSKNIYEPKSQNFSEKNEDEDEMATSEIPQYSSKKENEPGRHIVDYNKSQFKPSEIPVTSDEHIRRSFSNQSSPEVNEHSHSVTGKKFKSFNYKPSDVKYNSDRKFSSTGNDSHNFRQKSDGNDLPEKSSNDEESKRTGKHHSSSDKLRTRDETRLDDTESIHQETPKSTDFYKEPDKSYKDLERPNVQGPTENERLHSNYKGKPETGSESYKQLREEEEKVEEEAKEDPVNHRPSIERGAEDGRWFSGSPKISTEDHGNLPERNKEDSTRRVPNASTSSKEEFKDKHVSSPRKLQSVYDSPREFDVEDNEESLKPPPTREDIEDNDVDDDDDDDNVPSIKEENEEEEEEEKEEEDGPPTTVIEQRPNYNRYPNKETHTPVPPVRRGDGRHVNKTPSRNYISNNNNYREPNLRHPATSTFIERQNPNPGRVEQGRDYHGRREPHLVPKFSYKDGRQHRKNNYKPNQAVQTLSSQRGSRGRYVPISYVSTYDGDLNTITSQKPEDVQEDGLYEHYGIGEKDFIGLPKWESFRTRPKIKDTQHIQQEESSVNSRSTVYAKQQAVLPKRRKPNPFTYKEEETKPRSYRNKPNPPISPQRKYNRDFTEHRGEAKHQKSSDADLNGNEYGYKMNSNFEADNSDKESRRNKPKNLMDTTHSRGYKYPTNESRRGGQTIRNKFGTEHFDEESAKDKPKSVGRSYKYSTNESPKGRQNSGNELKLENSEEETAINKPKTVGGSVVKSYKYPMNESPRGGQQTRNNFPTENSNERDEDDQKNYEDTVNKTPIKEDWRRNHNKEHEDDSYTQYDEPEKKRERYRHKGDREHDIEDDDNSEEYPKRYQTFSKYQPIPHPAKDNTEENDEQHEVVYTGKDDYQKEKDHYTFIPHDKYYEHEDDKTTGYDPYYKDDHAAYDSDYYHSGYQGPKHESSDGADDSKREDVRKTAVSREVVRDKPNKIHINSQASGRGGGREYHRGSTEDDDKLYQGSVSSVAVTQQTDDKDDDGDHGNKEDSLNVAYGAAATRRFGGASSSNAATNTHQDKHRHKGSLLQGDNCKYKRGKATNGVRDVEDWEEYGRRREYHYTLGDKELADLFGGQRGATSFGGSYNVLQYAPPFNNGAHLLQDSVNQYVFGW